MKLSKHLAAGNDTLVKVADQTSNAVAGTRSTHAHGLTDHVGNAVTPSIIIPVVQAGDADGSLSATTVHVVKADDTNVTVRASAAEVDFDLYVG